MTDRLGRLEIDMEKSGNRKPLSETAKSIKRSILRNSTTIGNFAQKNIANPNEVATEQRRSLARKSTLFNKESITWDDIFGKFLKDVGVNLHGERVKSKKDIFNNNPFLRHVPLDPKVNYYKEDYMQNFEKFLSGQLSANDLIANNNFPSLNQRKLKFERELSLKKGNSESPRKPTLKEIKLALNKIEELEKSGKKMIVPELNSNASPRGSLRSKSIIPTSSSVMTTEKLKMAVMNNILTNKISERRDIIQDRKRENAREVKLFKNFYNISSDYITKIKNRNLLKDQTEDENMYSLKTTLKLKNHVILTEDSSKHSINITHSFCS